MQQCKLSVSGLGNATQFASDIKQARYGIQVAVCSIYYKLKEAHNNSGNGLDIRNWLELKSTDNPMIFYWKTILELELTILVFIRSIRESNFSLYVISVRSLMKWYYSMDHYNYARWLSVHLFDLVQLQYTLPDVMNILIKDISHFKKPEANSLV